MASLFTKIINREIPAQILAETDTFIAILDINPVNYGHTLIITKHEYPDFTALPEDILGPLMAFTQRVAHSILEATKATGFNVLMNSKPASGQEIFHFHAHIIPRFEGDGYTHWKGKPYKDNDHMAQTATAIRTAIEEGR